MARGPRPDHLPGRGDALTSRERSLLAVLLALGPAVWVGISAWTGRREAFDTGGYFSLGLPLMALASAVAGYLEPARAWRWGLAPMALQPAALLVWSSHGEIGNLFPLGLAAFAVLSVPGLIAAYLGAFIGRRTAP